MKKFKRDHIILFFLLPLVIIGGYVSQYGAPAARKHSKMSDKIASLGSEKTIRMESVGLERRLKEAEAKLVQLEDAANKAASSVSPANRLHALSALCQTCGVDILSYEQANSRATQAASHDTVRRWNVTFEASYAALNNFLTALAKDTEQPIVESLSVHVIQGSERRRYLWTLTLAL